MKIIGLFWIGGLIITSLFIISSLIIEKNFDESHPIKKWWRKHMVGNDMEL